VQTYRYIETLIEIAEARVIAEGHASPGETIAITSGMPVGAGGTNVLKSTASRARRVPSRAEVSVIAVLASSFGELRTTRCAARLR